MTAPRSYKTILRATGRYRFLPVGHCASLPKKPGDLAISRTDRPMTIIRTA